MKIIEANAEYLDVKDMHPYQFMELAGRTCYKSESKITESSAKQFVDTLKKNKHTAMLEHAHIILQTTEEHATAVAAKLNASRYLHDGDEVPAQYIHVTIHQLSDKGNYISGSFRAFMQLYAPNQSDMHHVYKCELTDYLLLNALSAEYPDMFQLPDDKTPTEPTDCKVISRDEFVRQVIDAYDDFAEQRYVIAKHLTHTIRFTCDRGVSHEFVRHRPASFAQESTRYCNYSSDKFGNEITVIRPCFWKPDSGEMIFWENSCENAESIYFKLLESGATPQEARSVLPNSLKTELIITATEAEWQHIINLRYHGTTGKPHPQMYEVMKIAYPLLTKASNHRLK